jgi:hypothetical protein
MTMAVSVESFKNRIIIVRMSNGSWRRGFISIRVQLAYALV